MSRNALYFSAGVVTALSIAMFHSWLARKETITARKRVLCFGDSITQHGFNPEDGWVSNLAYWWARRVDILNRGFSGYNSRWALKMLDEVVIAEKPDFIFIFFGANDAVDESVLQHVPLAEYRKNMESMVTRIQRAFPSIPIVILSPPPIDEEKLSLANKEKGRVLLIDRTNERTLTYVNACKELSEKFDLKFVDLFSALEGNSKNRADYLIDGLHLNAKGNKTVFKAIRKLLLKELPEWTPDLMPMHMPEWSKVSSDPRFQ